MSIIATRHQRRQLDRENAKQPALLTLVPPVEWPLTMQGNKRLQQVWRSRNYLVQQYVEGNGIFRLSINKTILTGDRWDDGLTWDELQEIKRQCGYGDAYAIEIYPQDKNVVNVANMRHLWVLPEPLAIGWVRKESA